MTEREQKLGLTFSQILSIFGLLIVIGGSWISLNQKITENSIKIEQLEKGRLENANDIKDLSKENKTDHQLILNKLDTVISNIKSK